MTRNEAKQFIEGLKKVQSILTDEQAIEVAGLFPKLKGDGALVKSGTRINHNGKIFIVAADLWDTLENSPENAPTLYTEIGYKNDIRIIPEVFTPGEAFSVGELGIWKDKTYKSLIDANVYTPEAYPLGWELIAQ